jgi:hypothetical protein
MQGDSIAVVIGMGDTSFANPEAYDAGGPPLAVVLADYNGDGVLEIAFTVENQLGVLLSNP